MRVDYHHYVDVIEPLRELGRRVRRGGLEPELLELVRIRASQINGCAHCLEMHTKDARAQGESGDRIDLVCVWKETAAFSERERAALRWCEELTWISARDVPDELYDEVRRVFSEAELVELTSAIVVINGWNRFAVAFRAETGNYVPREHVTTETP